jgi:hypothetical protein
VFGALLDIDLCALMAAGARRGSVRMPQMVSFRLACEEGIERFAG